MKAAKHSSLKCSRSCRKLQEVRSRTASGFLSLGAFVQSSLVDTVEAHLGIARVLDHIAGLSLSMRRMSRSSSPAGEGVLAASAG